MVIERMKARDRVLGLILLILFCFFIYSEYREKGEEGYTDFYHSIRPWFLVVLLVLYFSSIIPPVLAAHRAMGYRALKHVVAASFVSLMVLTAALYYFIYILAGDLQKADRFLNLPVAVFAVFSALLGVYVSYQSASRASRMKNAYDLLALATTNQEIISRMLAVRRVYPIGARIETPYRPDLASPSTLAAIERQIETEGKTKELQEERQKCEAHYSLRRLLNFYENMAVWIRQEGADEDVLYDTLSPVVIDLFELGEPFIKECRKSAPYYYYFLEHLVLKWRKRLKEEEGLINGGNHPLEQEIRSLRGMQSPP